MPKYKFETKTLGQVDIRVVTAKTYNDAVLKLYSTYPQTDAATLKGESR
jgi:hypothetical protein